jgi:HD superfamily phosphohydrolase
MSTGSRSEVPLPKEFQDTEIIADPLNRMISISKFEKRIICCPEFQRLRRIKRLGFAHFVYPAAEYSRFTHSLGVCQQAKDIVDTINKNLQREDRYLHWRMHGRTTDNEIDREIVLITPFERVIISAAGLLHDLPHGPFSHEIEGILEEDGTNLIPDHDDLGTNPAFFLYLFDKGVSDLAVLLDHFSRLFVEYIFKKTGSVDVSDLTEDQVRKSPDWRIAITWLRHRGVLTDTGMVKVGVPNSPLQLERNAAVWKFAELPFLAVAIFEVLLFEKQRDWLSPPEAERLLDQKGIGPNWGVAVKTGWESGSKTISWRPIPGWFRAYRKDIIGNTICADLIDYVNRDGYHTGIVSTIDLKFLDRMMIVRALMPPIGDGGQKALKPPPNRQAYEDIPVSCEHVVFDIFDHKRGFIRQSVLTEILAYLQARYLLCERVYIHRVVEASRSMLQKIISTLGRITKVGGSKKLLSVEDLHPLNQKGPGEALGPICDDAFLNWVRALPHIETETYKQHAKELDDAIDLATLLLDRRAFREAVIYDGIHGFEQPGQLGGSEKSCRTLEAAFLTDPNLLKRLKECLDEIEAILDEAFDQRLGHLGADLARLKPRVSCLVGVRKWGKRYKPPLVLVARPLKEKYTEHGSLDVEPLLDCEDPPNIKKQLDALKASYDSLWKVYLFLHPVFHDKLFTETHERVAQRLADFAARNTGIKWRNAVDFEQLLSEPLDNVSYFAQSGGKQFFETFLIPAESNRLVLNFETVVRDSFRQAPNGKSSTLVAEFEKMLRKETVRERIRRQITKAETKERVEKIVAIAPEILQSLLDEKERGNILAMTAARDVDKTWQDLVDKAINQAFSKTEPRRPSEAYQPDLGGAKLNDAKESR